VDPTLLTVLRDFSLGSVAVVGMLWLLQKVVAWQQEERKAWTAKVQDYADGQRDDKLAMAKVMEATASAVQRMTDKQASAEDKQATSTTALAVALDKIGVNMDKTASILSTITQSLDAASIMRKTDKTDIEAAIGAVHTSVLAVHEDVKRHRRIVEKKGKVGE
jgi:hypothetical protein